MAFHDLYLISVPHTRNPGSNAHTPHSCNTRAPACQWILPPIGNELRATLPQKTFLGPIRPFPLNSVSIKNPGLLSGTSPHRSLPSMPRLAHSGTRLSRIITNPEARVPREALPLPMSSVRTEGFDFIFKFSRDQVRSYGAV